MKMRWQQQRTVLQRSATTVGRSGGHIGLPTPPSSMEGASEVGSSALTNGHQRSESESRATRQQVDDLRVLIRTRDDAIEEQRRVHVRDMDETNLVASKQALEGQVKLQQFVGEQARLQVGKDGTGNGNNDVFMSAVVTSAGSAVGSAAATAMCIMM